MQHDEIRELIASYALDAVSPEEAQVVVVHLQDCPACAEEARALRAAASELAFAVPPRQVPPALRAKVLGAVERSASAGISAPTRVPEPRRATGTPWILAMAATLAAILAGAAALTLRLQNGSLSEQLRLARAQNEAAQQQMLEARAQLASAQVEIRLVNATTGILAAPDVVRVDLKGEPAAPAAIGRAFWSRSRGVLFTANALPGPARQRRSISSGWLRPTASP